jgi:hypothetical protein
VRPDGGNTPPLISESVAYKRLMSGNAVSVALKRVITPVFAIVAGVSERC